MKKKLTPLEKKELAYNKDHRTHTGEPDRAMSRLWANRKVRVNRKSRRKTDQAFRNAISPDGKNQVWAGVAGPTRARGPKALAGERSAPKWVARKLRESSDA